MLKVNNKDTQTIISIVEEKAAERNFKNYYPQWVGRFKDTSPRLVFLLFNPFHGTDSFYTP